MTAGPTSGPSRWVRLQQVGLLLAAVGLLGRRLGSEGALWSLGPGLAVLALGLVLLQVRPGRLTVGAGAVLAGLVLIQLTGRPGTPTGSGVVVWAVRLEALGLAVVLLAAAAAVVASLLARRGWRPGALGRGAQVLGLLVLAPVCAEYLAAYDDTTGDPVALLAGLVVFVPLYGCPALVIREVARRYGLGWPGIVLLGLAFGLLQASVVDESLFSDDYRDVAGWEETYRTTLIAPLGISAVNLTNFVGGHAVFSIAAPIALAEAAGPSRAGRPWVGRTGLALAGLGWLGASALVLTDTRRTEGPQASATQRVLSCVLVLALVGAAVVVARRRRPVASACSAPRVPVVLAVALVLAYAQSQAPESWVGVGVVLLTDALAVAGFVRASRRTGWGPRQVAAAAAAALLVRVVLAFTYAPLVGHVAAGAALGHHVAMLVLVVTVGALALRPRPDRPPGGRSAGAVAGAGTKAP